MMKSIAEILRDEFPNIEYRHQSVVSRELEMVSPDPNAITEYVRNVLKTQLANAVALKMQVERREDPTSMSHIYSARVFAFTPDELSRLIDRFYWTGVEDERSNNTYEKPKEPKGLREMKRLIRLEESTGTQKRDKRNTADALPYLEPLTPKLYRRKKRAK